MSQARYHIGLALLFCTVLLLIVPQTRITNLFLKSSIPIHDTFTFIAQEDTSDTSKNFSPSDPSIYLRGKNVAYTTTGALCIIAEKQGSLFLHFPPPGDKTTTMLLDCYSIEGAQQNILITIPTENKSIVFSDRLLLRNKSFDISEFISPEQPFEIGFVSHVPAGKIILEKLVVRQVASAYALPPMDLLILFLMVVFFIVRSIIDFYKNVFLLWFAVILTAGLFMIGLIGELRPLNSTWYWLLLLTALIGFRNWKMKVPSSEWFAVIFSLALQFRWNALLDTHGLTLTGDAFYYKKLATAVTWADPFSTGTREPLYVWLQAISSPVFGPNNYQFYMITLLFSLGIVYLTYRLARKASSSTAVGLIASSLVSFNYYLVLLSARGERMDLFIFLILLYCLWILHAKNNSILAELITGLIAGCICLCWLFGILGTSLMYLLRIIIKRIKITHALTGVLMMIIVVGPFLLHQWDVYGDPFNALNVHANFYWNAELIGTPSYEQGPGTWYEYLFKEIGLDTFLYQTCTGYIRMLLNPSETFNKIFLGFYSSSSNSYFLFPFYLLGLMREVYQRRFWMLAMLFAFANLSPYLLDEYRDPRLLFFLIPFFAYFCASGVYLIGAGAETLLGRIKAKEKVPMGWLDQEHVT